MSDIKISEFPTITGAITGNELVPLVIANQNYKASLSQLGIPFSETTVAPGNYGNAAAVATFTVNSYGQLTTAQTLPIQIDTSALVSGSISVAQGGTGFSTYTDGQLLIGKTDGTLAQATLSAGTGIGISNGDGSITVTNTAPDQVVSLTGDGITTVTGTYPSFTITTTEQYSGTVTSVDVSGGTTGLTTTGGPINSSGTITLSGTLITPNGGTGISSYTAGDMLYYVSGDALSKLALGASTYIITSSGSAPQWTDPATITVGSATTATTATSATSATTATNLAGGSAGSIPYQTAAGTTAMLSSGTGVLIGGSTPSYTMTPSLTQVTVAADPTVALQVATKQYVDTLVSSGITYHAPVKYEVPDGTGNLNATYNNGTAGVGATLTNAGTLAAFAPDGPTAQVGDRILVYNQTNAFENGIYEVTTVGDGSTPWVLTRTTDADSYGLKDPNALGEGDAFFITSGNTGAGETYVCNTSGVITFGTTAINFAQISFTQVYSAGTGLTLTGTQFSLTAPVTAALGGTGYTGYTDGQILIGKTDGSLAKSTITAGSGISVTNGDGTITIAASGGGGTVTSVDVSGGTTGLTFSGGPVTTTGTITMAGTLGVGYGGTGITTTPPAGAVAYGNGAEYAFTAAGSAGQVLLSNGTAAPAFGGIDGGTF